MMALVVALFRFQGGGPEAEAAASQDGADAHRGAAGEDGDRQTGEDQQHQQGLFFAITLIASRHMTKPPWSWMELYAGRRQYPERFHGLPSAKLMARPSRRWVSGFPRILMIS